MPFDPAPQGDSSEVAALRDQLIAEQTFAGIIFGSVLGVGAGLLVYLVVWYYGIIPLVLLFLPGVSAGFVAKHTGKALDIKYRLVCGLITFFALLVAAVLTADKLGIVLSTLLSFPNAILATLLSRRKLTYLEEKAIYKRRLKLDEA